MLEPLAASLLNAVENGIGQEIQTDRDNREIYRVHPRPDLTVDSIFVPDYLGRIAQLRRGNLDLGQRTRAVLGDAAGDEEAVA